MTSTFLDVSTLASVAAGHTRGEIPVDWAQGRASFGGLVAAIGLRPMLELVASDRSLRTLTVSFVAPVKPATPVDCHTQLLRAGKALSIVESRITQDAAISCVVSAAFGADRKSSVQVPVRRTAPLVDAGNSVLPPYIEGLTPRFVQHYAMRWVSGVPFGASESSRVVGDCASLTDHRAADFCDLLGLLDAWPPAVLGMLRAPAPASSVTWTVDFLSTAPTGRTDQPWAYEASAVAAGAGYAQTEAFMWDPHGNPIARSVQLTVVFG